MTSYQLTRENGTRPINDPIVNGSSDPIPSEANRLIICLLGFFLIGMGWDGHVVMEVTPEVINQQKNMKRRRNVTTRWLPFQSHYRGNVALFPAAGGGHVLPQVTCSPRSFQRLSLYFPSPHPSSLLPESPENIFHYCNCCICIFLIEAGCDPIELGFDGLGDGGWI